MRDEPFTIGDLAKATQKKLETIRYYERIGLMPVPTRAPNNYRAYRVEHLNRLSFIRRARHLGFSLAQVRALLGLADDRDPCPRASRRGAAQDCRSDGVAPRA